jgi:hypothetical protein
MSLETQLKTSLQQLAQDSTFVIHDITSNLFRCSAPLIKEHEGETYCRHRLILISTEAEGFLCGLESYEYVLSKKENDSKDRHIVYISKVDTTTTMKKYQGLMARVIQSYIASLPAYSSVFVFARAQPQYLFAKSAENKSKSILNDRDLVSWWLSVLNKVPVKCKGWWSVPGIDDTASALIEVGARKRGWKASEKIQWSYGTSYPQDADPSLVIPRFDDDAKSRLLKNIDSEDKTTVADFWNLLAFGEECGSGKVTGFFELRLQEPESNKDKSIERSDIKSREFTVFWNKFMSLDFHNEESIKRSTGKAIKDMEDVLTALKSFTVKTSATPVNKSIEENANSSADKRPAVNMLSSGFIKRKKI